MSPIRQQQSSGPQRVQVEKPVTKQVPAQILDANMTMVKLVYSRRGEQVTEEVAVPKALISAMSDPGESGMGAIEAMDMLARFYNDHVTSELDTAVLTGNLSMPATVLSTLIQGSYRKHALVAATTQKVSKGLLLEDNDVDARMRFVAALINNVSVEEVAKLSLKERTVFVQRTVTEVEKTPVISLKTKRLTCSDGSHLETIEVGSVPDKASVQEAQKLREQKLASLPKIKTGLDDVFGKIEEKRGTQLSPSERNAVVTHLNVTYVKNPEDWLPVIFDEQKK